MNLLDLILHIDQHLIIWAAYFGPWLYVILFLIVFAETGLVVTPFLPGDSLLFALGAMTVLGSENESGLKFPFLSTLLLAAALIGDNVNFFIGKSIGPKIFAKENSKIFHKKYLLQAQKFYDRHGSKAVVIARFMPIVRTFVPFVAGIGHMPYLRFLLFSFVGGAFWINLFLWAGRSFGNLPAVKTNFHVVIFAVILISMLPMLIAYLRLRFSTKNPSKDLSNNRG